MRDDERTHTEANGHGADEAEGLDPKPDSDAASLATDIVVHHDLLMRLLGHERHPEQVEERGQDIDVGEPQGQSGQSPRN